MIVLETERLLFRDHEPADLEPFCTIEADPEVRRFVGGPPRTRAAATRKFRAVYLPAVRDRMGLWATVFKPEGRYIGLASEYWGRGATEAGRAFIEFGFGELDLSRILASVEVGNEALRPPLLP